MPYSVERQVCTDSDGNEGEYVLRKDDTGEVMGCHTSRSSAEEQRQALEAAENRSVRADDTLVYWGGEVKITDQSDGEITVGGPLVQYGGRDLEGEYFTSDTYFGAQLATQGKAVLDTMFNHGMPSDDSLQELAARRYPPVTVTKADTGLMAEVILRQRDEYEALLARMADEGALGWSSGTAPHATERTEDGEITSWPLLEASLTHWPAEPRTRAVPLKSLVGQEPEEQQDPIIHSLQDVKRDLRGAALASSIRTLSRTIRA